MYLIDVPPTSISGSLHMGHVFSYTHMDIIARYHWRREDLVYPFCYDNNGLPTEKLCLDHGIAPEEMTAWSDDYADRYRSHFLKLDQRFDFQNQNYSTGSPAAIDLCMKSFDDLKAKGLAYKAETEYWYCPETGTSVSQSELDSNGRFERSGTKAILKKGEGWFIKIIDNIPRIRQAIEEINWHPEHFKRRLLRWLDEVKWDWSISRTRKFGIPIPGETDLTFDTWFISALSPQLAWNAYTGDIKLECPIFDVRFQAHDIIRTWALFTIVKSLYHNDQIPWKNLVISGHALSGSGDKISKSKGNATITPAEYLEEYGTPGVRYWASLNRTGTDTRIDPNMMAKGKRLVNKIKNAGIFLEGKEFGEDRGDLWSEWLESKTIIDAALDRFDWSEGIKELTRYFWGVFCDKRIEESKKTPCNGMLRMIYGELQGYFEVFLGSCKSAE